MPPLSTDSPGLPNRVKPMLTHEQMQPAMIHAIVSHTSPIIPLPTKQDKWYADTGWGEWRLQRDYDSQARSRVGVMCVQGRDQVRAFAHLPQVCKEFRSCFAAWVKVRVHMIFSQSASTWYIHLVELAKPNQIRGRAAPRDDRPYPPHHPTHPTHHPPPAAICCLWPTPCY